MAYQNALQSSLVSYSCVMLHNFWVTTLFIIKCSVELIVMLEQISFLQQL